ncbi:MAG: hypothetical protein AAF628_06165 [Planctomycetota bacterium]
MDDKYAMLRHFLGALAYRTQKALRGAPSTFSDFDAGHSIRSPRQLVRHMTDVLGHARTCFTGDGYEAHPLSDFPAEVSRFHEMLDDLGRLLADGSPLATATPEQLLQGPFADAMTHAGQLAMLRRLAGTPVPPENFMAAQVEPDRLGPQQARPRRPFGAWPEAPPGWAGPGS